MVAARVELAATINVMCCALPSGLACRVGNHQVCDHGEGNDAQTEGSERGDFGAKREEFEDTADDAGDDNCDESDADPVFRFHVMREVDGWPKLVE